MAWETFDAGPHRRATSTPYVTVNAGLRLSLNPPAMKALGNPRRVSLLFDPTAAVLGLRAADPDDANAYRVAPKTRQVAVAGLFAYYGLTVDVARRRPAQMVDGILCVNMATEGRAIGRRRNKIATRSGSETARPGATGSAEPGRAPSGGTT